MFPSRVLALPLLLLLVACSDSNDDGDGSPERPLEDPVAGAPVADGGTYLIGGGTCSSTGVSSSPGATAYIGDGDVDADDDAGPSRDDAPGTTPDVLSVSVTAACADDPTGLVSSGAAPTGAGYLMFEAREYALDGALRVVDAEGSGRDGELLLHDGETRVVRSASDSGNERTGGAAYGVYDGSVALSLTPFRGDGTRDPSGRTYPLVPGDADADAGGGAGPATGSGDAITDALLVIDIDGDGTISAGELFEPASGQLVWGGTADDPSLSFTFVLADGRAIEGAYEGGYERVEF